MKGLKLSKLDPEEYKTIMNVPGRTVIDEDGNEIPVKYDKDIIRGLMDDQLGPRLHERVKKQVRVYVDKKGDYADSV